MAKTWEILENESLLLKKPEPEDLEFLFTLENNPDFWFVSDTKAPYSNWQLKQHIENTVYDIYANKELRLVVYDKKTNAPVGIIDLFEFDPFHQRVGLGILIEKDFQNKGYAFDCITLVRDYCFKVLEIKQLWCNIDEENSLSIKLFEKLNFKRSGVLKKWKRKNGEYKDVYIYQLLNL